MPTDSLGVWTAGHSKYKTRIIMAKESTIQHYTSSTTGNTPSAVDLASGELAINIADEKVFLKNLLGNVVSLSQSKDLSGAFASKATVVTSFNGATGAVTGATLGANTFTALNSFNAGISAAGATFSSPITIPINTAPAITIGNAARNLTLGSIDSAGEIVQTGNHSGTLNIRQQSGGIVSIGDYLGSGNVTYISVDDVNSTININAAIINTGVLSANGYILSSGGIIAKTASYTLTAADNGKIITMNVASANTLTVPASLAVGFNCTIIQLGAGQTTITASGTTLNSYQSYLKISGQHGSASIVSYTSNVYNVAGSLSA